MVTVEFLGPLNHQPLNMQAITLADVATKLKEDKSLKEWLDNVAVAVNDHLVSDLNFVLYDGDKVSLLPPVCGG